MPPRPTLVGDKDRLIPAALRAKVLSHLGQHKVEPVRIAILLADQAGLRCSEIVNLRVGDCDVDAPPYRLMIRGAKHRAKDHVDEQPIPADLRDALKRWISGRGLELPSGQYLVSQSFTPWARQTVYRLVKGVHAACGVPVVYSVHSWRHGYGTRVYRQTKDLILTQRMLRHRSTKPTERYVHMADADDRVKGLLAGLVNAAEPAEKPAAKPAKARAGRG